MAAESAKDLPAEVTGWLGEERYVEQTEFPIEMGYATPSHMGMPGEVWGVAKELEVTFGWTEKEIRGFLGENLLRVWQAAEDYAATTSSKT